MTRNNSDGFKPIREQKKHGEFERCNLAMQTPFDDEERGDALNSDLLASDKIDRTLYGGRRSTQTDKSHDRQVPAPGRVVPAPGGGRNGLSLMWRDIIESLIDKRRSWLFVLYLIVLHEVRRFACQQGLGRPIYVP